MFRGIKILKDVKTKFNLLTNQFCLQLPTRPVQLSFHPGSIGLIGFAIGAHLSFVIGLEFELADGFYAFIQTHGHAQFMGWAGLFIIGISLHSFLRLAGAPLARPRRLSFILWLIAGGNRGQ